jgi:hypothetical protein
MPTATDVPVSEHLRRISPAARATVQAARRTVKSAAPKAKELGYRSSRAPGAKSPSMYKMIRYLVDDVQVAGIGAFRKDVSLFFRRGSEIDDDSVLLEGSGTARFIRLRTPAEAAGPAVKRIVKKAFKLATSSPSPR